VSETAQDRRAQLQAELEELERQEREEAEERRRSEELARREQALTPEQQQRAEELEAKANEELDREYPQAWKPKANLGHPQQLVGAVIGINPMVGPSPQFGTYSAAIELRTVAGDEWTVWAPHSGAIFSQLVRLKIQPHEVIAVRYRGSRESQSSGFTYDDYRLVRVEGDGAGDPDWIDYDQLAAQREAPQLPPAPAATEPDDDIPF
jgi:hypothetical protein